MINAETKILFSGPMGAGKTTAIAAVSEVTPISTDAFNSDRESFDKDGTTVALDFGLLHLPDGQTLRLFGTPGQERFRFMWDILAQGAMGVIILINAAEPMAATHLRNYTIAFQKLCENRLAVIGVGRHDAAGAVSMATLQNVLDQASLNLPMFRTDVRKRDHVVLLLDTLLCMIESKAELGRH